MGPPRQRSHATEIECRRGLDGCRVRQRQSFRRRQRPDSFWRHRKAREGRLFGGRGFARQWKNSRSQDAGKEIRQARRSRKQKQNSGEKGEPLTMATAAKETGIKPAAATQVTFLEAIKQAMYEEMERDPAVVLIGEDIGVYGGAFKTSEGLLGKFGWERVIDTPISESAIVGAACGMSYLGLRPIAEMQFIDFIVCAFNQITNFVAKGHYLWNAPAPMVIRGPDRK